MIFRVSGEQRSSESISIGLFGKRKTQNLLNISDSISKNAIGNRVRERDRGSFSWLNSALIVLVPDLDGYNMRIYCFNQEFISCSTNGNDPTPNKILLTRSIYGWGRRQGKLETTMSVNNLTSRIYHGHSLPSLS